jgi:hypothetical protein
VLWESPWQTRPCSPSWGYSGVTSLLLDWTSRHESDDSLTAVELSLRRSHCFYDNSRTLLCNLWRFRPHQGSSSDLTDQLRPKVRTLDSVSYAGCLGLSWRVSVVSSTAADSLPQLELRRLQHGTPQLLPFPWLSLAVSAVTSTTRLSPNLVSVSVPSKQGILMAFQWSPR